MRVPLASLARPERSLVDSQTKRIQMAIRRNTPGVPSPFFPGILLSQKSQKMGEIRRLPQAPGRWKWPRQSWRAQPWR